MKKYILLSFLISVLLSSCKEKTVIENELDSLGINKENYTKIDTAFYENKKVKSLRFYNVKTEFVDVNFYESGKKKSIGKAKDNQCNDEYIDWYENGKQKWIRKYNLGIQIGKSISFQENGNLKKDFDNDTKESTDYWENGKPKFKFIDNKSQSYHYFNGNFMEKYGILEKDKYTVEYFNENGEVVFSGLFNNDILYKNDSIYNGKIVCFFNNGKKSHFEEVVNGKHKGEFYSYFGNGILKFEGKIENGKEVFYKCYYENGKVNFIRDGKNNTFTQWDETGKLMK